MSKKNQVLAVVGLVLFCTLVFVFLWARDPAHRGPSTIGKGPRLTPTPVQPYMLINNPLVTAPGLDVQADWNPKVVLCWAEENEPVTVLRAEQTMDGSRFLLVRAAACSGWTREFTVKNHRP